MIQKSYAAYETEEHLVKPYLLPDPLRNSDGTKVRTAQEWMNCRRPELFRLFQQEEYGEILPRPDGISFHQLSLRDNALENTAIRKEIRLDFASSNGNTHSVILLLYLPKRVKGPVPAFLGLNFNGNHTTTDEPDVIRTGFRMPGQLVEEKRGSQSDCWCFRELIRRGYASATLCYHDLFPDVAGSISRSVFRLFLEEPEYDALGKQYSVIGAWAWGLSRAMDFLETEPAVDHSKVMLHGHSRLGKTALWAGAIDRRFAMVIANESGCGGAALHKRKFGENLSQHFDYHRDLGIPIWFVDACRKYIWKEEEMPFDQHELLALIAPRPLCIGTATLDAAADPYGEFLSCVHASPIYELFGSRPFPGGKMIPPDTWISGAIHFHSRSGDHDQTPWDWARYLDAADLHWKHSESGE